ncbi:MAG: MFS transporter [Myxococcales bacterium]|nr:MFS transporter [Myxococcales bacterium]USN50067.1 MAG: MFS transporter [Myxococcales bacterium]
MASKYRQSPDHEMTGWPPGIKYIVGNEGCERFSYYGMNAILYVYCVTLFVTQSMPEDQAADMATSTVHLFKTGVYAFPMIGAIIADRFLGKYNTILWISLVYCLGHLVLSLTEGSIVGLTCGLVLIAIGSGGIKPCVSAHVGDQFGRSNWRYLERVYQIFYFIINFGSFFAVLFIPLIKEYFGWSIAFAIPGILMFIATILFWMGRNEFVHIPARPGGKLGFLDALSSTMLFLTFGSWFFTASQPLWIMLAVSCACLYSGFLIFSYRQSLSRDDGFLAVSTFMLKEWMSQFFVRKEAVLVAAGSHSSSMRDMGRVTQSAQKEFGDEAVEGVKAVFRIMSVFIMVSIFWALFDQHASSWIRQAEMMDRSMWLPFIGEITLLPSQIPSLNPVIVMILIPFWAYTIDPALKKVGIVLTPLKKMTLGMLLAATSFMAVALLQARIEAAGDMQIHVMWQLIPYFLITLSEILVSITGLEFAYSQAPKRMKSTVMGFWLLTVALGNALVAFLAHFSHLALTNFFWLFAGLMAVAAVIFAFRASAYKVRDYHQ